MKVQWVTFEWYSDSKQQQQTKEHLPRCEYRGIEILSVSLYQDIRIGDKNRTENQRYAASQRLWTGNGELIRKHYRDAAHAENHSADPGPTQTLTRQM